MESGANEATAHRRPRRPRGRGRRAPFSDASGTGPAEVNSNAADARRSRRRNRTNGIHIASSPLQDHSSDHNAVVAAPTDLTWQQRGLLNIDAPDFNPQQQAHLPRIDDGSNVPFVLFTDTSAGRPHDRTSGKNGGGNKKTDKSSRNKSKKSNTAPKVLHTQRDERQHINAPQGALDSAHSDLPESGPPHCLLCTNPSDLISFGSCDHHVACGACCLRLRKCYGRADCPLCKTDLPEVVVAPWRQDLPNFEFFATLAPNAAACSKPGELGPGRILADRWQPQGQPSSRLLDALRRSTYIACALCDPKAGRPFSRLTQLEAHLRERHRRSVCGMCLREGRDFPLNAALFESKTAMQEHAEAAHPRCSFCQNKAFFDGDALWAHMMERHFRCQLCEPGPSGDHPWFADADDLRTHLGSEHFACDVGECAGSLVAFTTADELRRHALDHHSGRMARWNQATARPLHFDIQFVRGPSGGAQGGQRHEEAEVSGRDRRRQRGRVGFAREMEGGIRVIDDDLGLAPDAFANVRGRAVATRMEGTRDAYFPSLSASTVETSVRTVGPSTTSQQSRQRPPPLVKHTVRCPCGRRVTYPVVEEGQPVPGLECDAVCHLEGRRRTLADAFGVTDPEKHVSSFDRRPVVWSGALLEAAKRDPAWVESIERELGMFVADGSIKRRVLAPMPQYQRALVHAMAEQYGLASASSGQEPRRAVELFKAGENTTGALPSRLLSRVASTVTDEELATLLRASQGFPVRFGDIAPAVDLHYYLRRWDGRFATEWESGTSAVVRFDDESDRTEVLDWLGGGIRGLFRIDRGWQPRTGVPAAGTATVAAPWAGDGPAASNPSTGTGKDAPSWNRVAGAPPVRVRELGLNGGGTSNGAESSAPVVPAGWAVIGGKRAAKPRRAAKAAAVGEAGDKFATLQLLDEQS